MRGNKMQEVCWLPELINFSDYNGDWQKYENVIYSIFKTDFIDTAPVFQKSQVNIRRHPMVGDKEEAFIHITHQDYNKDGERLPDMRRCERIRWVRSFIENYNCDATKCSDCDGIKIWENDAQRGTDKRIHLLLEEERYIVVLERREKYCLLITSFYIQYDHELRKKLKHYDDYKKLQKG